MPQQNLAEHQDQTYQQTEPTAEIIDSELIDVGIQEILEEECDPADASKTG